jgi:hypothetical protein
MRSWLTMSKYPHPSEDGYGTDMADWLAHSPHNQAAPDDSKLLSKVGCEVRHLGEGIATHRAAINEVRQGFLT